MPDQPNADTSQAKDGTNGAGASGDDASTKYVTLEALQGVLGSFSAELTKSLDAKLGKAVNAAAAQHAEKVLKQRGLDALTPDAIKRLAEVTAPKPDDAGGDAEADTAQAAKPSRKDSKEGKADSAGTDFEALLKKQQQEFEKRIRSVEERTQKQIEEERALRTKAERLRVEEIGASKARDILSKHVAQGASELAFDVLRARNHLIVGDDGTPYFRRAGASDDDEPLAFEDGLKEHFLKDPASKFLVPAQKPNTPSTKPRPASATGNGGSGNGSSTNPADIAEAAHQRLGMPLSQALFSSGSGPSST